MNAQLISNRHVEYGGRCGRQSWAGGWRFRCVATRTAIVRCLAAKCFYFCDWSRIRKLSDDGLLFSFFCLRLTANIRSGLVSTVAGSGERGYCDGDNAEAEFNNPFGICCDPTDPNVLLIGDSGNHCICRIDLKTGLFCQTIVARFTFRCSFGCCTGQTSTIAGAVGEKGYRDGDAKQALFD